MAICPLMSNPKDLSDTNSLYPCINACELLTKHGCSLKLLAQSQYEILKKTNETCDKT